MTTLYWKPISGNIDPASGNIIVTLGVFTDAGMTQFHTPPNVTLTVSPAMANGDMIARANEEVGKLAAVKTVADAAAARLPAILSYGGNLVTA